MYCSRRVWVCDDPLDLPTRDHILRENLVFFPQRLMRVPHLGVGVHEPLPIRAGRLTGFCRPCAARISCRDSTNAVVLSRLEDAISRQFSQSLDLTSFLSHFSTDLSLGGCGCHTGTPSVAQYPTSRHLSRLCFDQF